MKVSLLIIFSFFIWFIGLQASSPISPLEFKFHSISLPENVVCEKNNDSGVEKISRGAHRGISSPVFWINLGVGVTMVGATALCPGGMAAVASCKGVQVLGVLLAGKLVYDWSQAYETGGVEALAEHVVISGVPILLTSGGIYYVKRYPIQLNPREIIHMTKINRLCHSNRGGFARIPLQRFEEVQTIEALPQSISTYRSSSKLIQFPLSKVNEESSQLQNLMGLAFSCIEGTDPLDLSSDLSNLTLPPAYIYPDYFQNQRHVIDINTTQETLSVEGIFNTGSMTIQKELNAVEGHANGNHRKREDRRKKLADFVEIQLAPFIELILSREVLDSLKKNSKLVKNIPEEYWGIAFKDLSPEAISKIEKYLLAKEANHLPSIIDIISLLAVLGPEKVQIIANELLILFEIEQSLPSDIIDYLGIKSITDRSNDPQVFYHLLHDLKTPLISIHDLLTLESSDTGISIERKKQLKYIALRLEGLHEIIKKQFGVLTKLNSIGLSSEGYALHLLRYLKDAWDRIKVNINELIQDVNIELHFKKEIRASINALEMQLMLHSKSANLQNWDMKFPNPDTMIIDFMNLLLQTVQALVHEYHITINLKFINDVRGKTLNGASVKLFHVLQNIIVNAVEAFNGSIDRRIMIQVGIENESMLTVKIEDTAGGIPKHILEEWQNGGHIQTTKPNGSGNGLHIIKETMQHIQGSSMNVEVTPQGTNYFLKIPVK